MKHVVKQLVLHHVFQFQKQKIDAKAAKSSEAAKVNFDQKYCFLVFWCQLQINVITY